MAVTLIRIDEETSRDGGVIRATYAHQGAMLLPLFLSDGRVLRPTSITYERTREHRWETDEQRAGILAGLEF